VVDDAVEEVVERERDCCVLAGCDLAGVEPSVGVAWPDSGLDLLEGCDLVGVVDPEFGEVVDGV
jgi:hypothetical protein